MSQNHLTHAQTTLPLDRQRAFLLLFRGKTYQAVWSWLRRLGVPRRDRRDIVQDVFLAGYQSFPTYDPLRARPERWLNRITVHVAAHYRDRAHHRREELTSGDDPSVADERPTAEEEIEAEQTRSLILERLHALQAEERTLLMEHDIDGIPMATIAARHGIPLSTAYKWRARAMVALRALMEEPHQDGKRRRSPLPSGSARRAQRSAAPRGRTSDVAGSSTPPPPAPRPPGAMGTGRGTAPAHAAPSPA